MRRLKFNVLIPYCESHWEPRDPQEEPTWPSAPTRSSQCLVKKRSRARQRQWSSLYTYTAKTFFQGKKKKKTAFDFLFSEAQLPRNAEHNQRHIRDRGILTQVHLSQTSAKNDTFTILYQMKPHLCEPQIKCSGTFSQLHFKHNAQKTSL